MKRRSMIAAAGMSGFATTAASARPSPAQHPLNVRDFGATGDGKTDDTAAIQGALDRAGTNGALYFQDGQYVVSKVLVSQNENISIVGESWNAELIRARTSTGGIIAIYGAGTLITRLTLNGNGTVVSPNAPDLALSAPYCAADRIQVLNSPNTAIDISANHCIVRACSIFGLQNPQVQSYGIWAINYATGVMIRDNFISGTGIDGIGISGDGYQVIGNYLQNCHAFTAESGGQLVVYNNLGTTANGLIMGNTIGPGNANNSVGMELNGTDTTVVGNSIHSQKDLGISLVGNGWLISDNTIKNSGQASGAVGCAIILNAGASDFTITGNRLIDNQATPTQTYGVIVAAGNSNFYSITGNQITGNINEPIMDGGTGLNKIVRDNVGIDDVIPTVAAGATLALPLNPVFALGGDAAVTALTGPAWKGRMITILPAGALSLRAGGNIANSLSVAANTPVTGLFNGTAWFFK